MTHKLELIQIASGLKVLLNNIMNNRFGLSILADKIAIFIVMGLLGFSSLSTQAQFNEELESHARNLYSQTGLSESEVPFDHFFSGYQRFLKGKQEGDFNKSLITYVNFSIPSNKPRFFTVDISNSNPSVVYRDYVSHGVGSGSGAGDKLNPTRFTNTPQTKTSSLGFYRVKGRNVGSSVGPYVAVYGLSGPEYNSKAEEREILIHSGSYVGATFARNWGVIGESWGCFAIPEFKLDEVLSTLDGGTLLYAFKDEVFNPEVEGDLMGVAQANNQSSGNRIDNSNPPPFESVSERLNNPSSNVGGTDFMEMTGADDNEAEGFDDASEPADFEEENPEINSSGKAQYAGNEGYERCQQYADRPWGDVVTAVQGGAHPDQFFQGSWVSFENLFYQSSDNITNTQLVSEAREHLAEIRECAMLASISNSTNFQLPNPNTVQEVKSNDGSITCQYRGSEGVDYQKCLEMLNAHNDLLDAEKDLHNEQSIDIKIQGNAALENLKKQSGDALQTDSLTAAADLTSSASMAAAARIDFQKERANILIQKLEEMPNHSSLMQECNQYYSRNQDVGVKGYQAFVANIKFADTSLPTLSNPCAGAVNRIGVKYIHNKKAKDQVKDYLDKIGVKIDDLEGKKSELNRQVHSIREQNLNTLNETSMGKLQDFSTHNNDQAPEAGNSNQSLGFAVSNNVRGGMGAINTSGSRKGKDQNDFSSFSQGFLNRGSKTNSASRSKTLTFNGQSPYKEKSNLSKFFSVLKSNNLHLVQAFMAKYGLNQADLTLALKRGVLSKEKYQKILASFQGRLPASQNISAWLRGTPSRPTGNREWQIEKNKEKNIFQIISQRYNKKSAELLEK